MDVEELAGRRAPRGVACPQREHVCRGHDLFVLDDLALKSFIAPPIQRPIPRRSRTGGCLRAILASKACHRRYNTGR